MQLADSADDTSLLVRRNCSTGELAYYLCWSPDPQPLAALVAVAGRRWAIEETFQTAKSQIGLDHHQLRRWITISCAAGPPGTGSSPWPWSPSPISCC